MGFIQKKAMENLPASFYGKTPHTFLFFSFFSFLVRSFGIAVSLFLKLVC